MLPNELDPIDITDRPTVFTTRESRREATESSLSESKKYYSLKEDL